MNVFVLTKSFAEISEGSILSDYVHLSHGKRLSVWNITFNEEKTCLELSPTYSTEKVSGNLKKKSFWSITIKRFNVLNRFQLHTFNNPRDQSRGCRPVIQREQTTCIPCLCKKSTTNSDAWEKWLKNSTASFDWYYLDLFRNSSRFSSFFSEVDSIG